MKTLKILFVASFFVCSSNVISQTPEQKKQAEEMQKNAENMMKDMEKMQAEAQRQYDSIMNTQQMQDIEAKNKAIMEQMDKDKEKRKAERAQANASPKPSTSKHLMSKDSGTKFENWTYGPAEIVLLGMARYNTSSGYKRTIGSVESNGNFNFELPEDLSTFMTVSDARWVNCARTSGGTKQQWSKPGAGMIQPTMRIMQNGEELGTVFWASSIAVIDGQTTVSDYSGSPGHYMNLVYVSAPSSTKAVCTYTRGQGTGSEFKLNHVINVDFKKGWNMVKHTFEGERITDTYNTSKNYYKDEKITAQQDLSPDTRWIFIPK